MEKEIRKHWDEKVSRYGARSFTTGWGGHLRKIEVNEVKRTIPSKGTILDLGCGNGYVLEKMVSQDRELIGLDLSRNMVLITKKRLGRDSEVVLGHASSLPFKDCCVDYAYSIRTLIFVIDEKKEKAIDEMIRVLKTGSSATLIECTVEGIENLNKLRHLLGISSLPTHRLHLFFKKSRLERVLRKNRVQVQRRVYLPIMSVLEKVLYPKIKRIRGMTRVFSLFYLLAYNLDVVCCKLFPVIGYDIMYVYTK